jgi:hypothetical protein
MKEAAEFRLTPASAFVTRIGNVPNTTVALGVSRGARGRH